MRTILLAAIAASAVTPMAFSQVNPISFNSVNSASARGAGLSADDDDSSAVAGGFGVFGDLTRVVSASAAGGSGSVDQTVSGGLDLSGLTIDFDSQTTAFAGANQGGGEGRGSASLDFRMDFTVLNDADFTLSALLGFDNNGASFGSSRPAVRLVEEGGAVIFDFSVDFFDPITFDPITGSFTDSTSGTLAAGNYSLTATVAPSVTISDLNTFEVDFDFFVAPAPGVAMPLAVVGLVTAGRRRR
ncbi:MAG: hypothetical protein AAGJ54_07180 [Planctomycetota bacterium]